MSDTYRVVAGWTHRIIDMPHEVMIGYMRGDPEWEEAFNAYIKWTGYRDKIRGTAVWTNVLPELDVSIEPEPTLTVAEFVERYARKS